MWHQSGPLVGLAALVAAADSSRVQPSQDAKPCRCLDRRQGNLSQELGVLHKFSERDRFKAFTAERASISHVHGGIMFPDGESHVAEIEWELQSTDYYSLLVNNVN